MPQAFAAPALLRCSSPNPVIAAWWLQTLPNAAIAVTLCVLTGMLIRSATFQISAPDLASCPVSDLPEFAFIGRSNVGKSSLLNMIAGGREIARVSPTPGHTQLINFYAIDHAWTLVDLPGYGYAKTAKTERDRFQDMIASYLEGRRNLACTFVLIDSRHTPQQIDLDFVQWLTHCPTPFALVFTKADTMKAGAVQKNIALFQQRMAESCGEIPRVFTTSAKTRSGKPELMAFIGTILG